MQSFAEMVTLRTSRRHPGPVAFRAAAVVAIICVGGVLAACGNSANPRAAPFTLRLAGGGEVTSQALQGKTVVLSFWATWCEPCRKELPALQRVYKAHYASRDDVRFFLVNEDRGPGAPAKARAWLQKHGVVMPSALDTSGAVGRALKAAQVLPTRLVIGPHGRVLNTEVGYTEEQRGFSALRRAIATDR